MPIHYTILLNVSWPVIVLISLWLTGKAISWIDRASRQGGWFRK